MTLCLRAASKQIVPRLRGLTTMVVSLICSARKGTPVFSLLVGTVPPSFRPACLQVLAQLGRRASLSCHPSRPVAAMWYNLPTEPREANDRRDYTVRVSPEELCTQYSMEKEPSPKRVKQWVRLLAGPSNDMNAQPKVMLVLHCFYQWPKLGKRLMTELHKLYRDKQRKKENLRKRVWARKKRATKKVQQKQKVKQERA